MLFTTIENYIVEFKKINKNDNYILKKIKIFLKKHINNEGYINTSNNKLNSDLIELLDFLINEKKIKHVLPLLSQCNTYLNVFNNEKIFYKDYFETLGINFSSLVTTNILFDEISKLIFIIYIFGTTINSFKIYILKNKKFNKNFNLKYLDILNDFIKTKNILNTYNFNSNSFKLLILGHLHYEGFNNHEKIIVENLFFTYGRIVLEIIKSKKNIRKDYIKSLYNNFLNQYSTPSTPMFYNSLKKKYNLLSSCFIINIEDSVKSIGFNLNKIFNIQKHNSGTGIILSKIRSSGRPVMDGVTESNSVLNFVDILSLMSNHYDNKKRNRSSNINLNLTIYHPEIINFLKIKVNNFKKEKFYYNKIFQTVIIPDEFIYRYLSGQKWYLIPSDQHIDGKYLHDCYGEEFSVLYNKMINNKNIIKTEISIDLLFSEIINTLIKTGGPFLFFEDIINETTNHKNLGKINGTNLCTEILEFTNDNKTACCNLSSINLTKFYYEKNYKKCFDFIKFKKVIKKVVYYLNTTIDNTYYSHKSCKDFNLSYRPIAIGIQGLANLFNLLNISYLDGEELYKKIVEYLYYYSLKYSNEFSKNKTFKKCSDNSNNIKTEFKFHFELFKEFQSKKVKKLKELKQGNLSKIINLDKYDSKYINKEKWDILRESIKIHGLSNSLVLGFMPTSISSGIYNNNESFEPFTHNIEKKSYSVYDNINYNQSLVNDLIKYKCFTEKNVLKELILNDGELLNLDINENLKSMLMNKYKNLYDFDIIDYLQFTNVADSFVDQGISFNISIKNNDNLIIAKSIISSWLLGKKTTYYYRTNTIIEPLSFNKKINTQTNLCYTKNNITCESCLS